MLGDESQQAASQAHPPREGAQIFPENGSGNVENDPSGSFSQEALQRELATSQHKIVRPDLDRRWGIPFFVSGCVESHDAAAHFSDEAADDAPPPVQLGFGLEASNLDFRAHRKGREVGASCGGALDRGTGRGCFGSGERGGA